MIFRSIVIVFCLTVSLGAWSQQAALSANSNTMVTRTPDSRGWTDPALNHNRLLQQRLGEGNYIVIGAYKVKGTPFLFGGRNNADLFTPNEKAYNIDISYNTYNQEVEFTSTANPSTPLMKEPGEVDSFIIRQNLAGGISQDNKFVYGTLLGTSEKAYFQVVEAGSRFSLYKRYRSELGYVSDNYVQSELRQFDMEADYFYYDAEKKSLKKLKLNQGSIIKEFKAFKDVAPVAEKESIGTKPEDALRRIIAYLNS